MTSGDETDLLLVTAQDLAQIRRRVAEAADGVGMGDDPAARFALAVNEIVTNAIQHGGGVAAVTITAANGQVVVEVRDNGHGIPASVPAELPAPEQPHGRGLWLARQFCDDIMISTAGSGTLVRLVAG